MGKITIDTALDNSGFERGYKQVQAATKSFVRSVTSNISDIGKSFLGTSSAITKQEALVDRLSSKYADLAREASKQAETKIGLEKSFTSANEEAQKLSDELEKLKARQKEIEAGGFTAFGKTAYGKTEREELGSIAAKIEEISPKYAEAENAADQFKEALDRINQTPIDTAEITRTREELEQATQELSNMQDRAQQTSQRMESIKTAAKAALSGIVSFGKSAISNIGNAASKVGNGIKAVTSKISNLLKRSHSDTNKLTDGIGKLFTRIKNLAAAALVFNVLRKALSQFRDYLGTALKANQQFANSFAQVKGNLATAFQPILQSIVPILATLMSWLASATAAIVQFMAALSGKSVKSLQSAAKGMDSLASSTSGASKAAKGAIANFDELNVITSDTGGGGGAGGGGVAPLYEDIAEPSAAWLEFVDKLMALEVDYEYFYNIGHNIAQKIVDGLNAIPWDTIRAWGLSFVDKAVAILNGFVEHPNIGTSIGHALAMAINTAVDWTYRFLTTFNFRALGERIGEFIMQAIRDIKWENVGATIAAWIKGAVDIAAGLLSKIKWKETGKDLAKGLNKLIEDMPAAEIGEVISDFLKGAIELSTTFMKETDWYLVGEKIREFILNIDWPGIWNALMELLESIWTGIGDFLAGLFGDTIKAEDALNTLKIVLLAIAAALIVVHVASLLAMGPVGWLILALEGLAVGAGAVALGMGDMSAKTEESNKMINEMRQRANETKDALNELKKAAPDTYKELMEMQKQANASPDSNAYEKWQYEVIAAAESAKTGIQISADEIEARMKEMVEYVPADEMGVVTSSKRSFKDLTIAAEETGKAVENSLSDIPEYTDKNVIAPLEDAYDAAFTGITENAQAEVATPVSDMFTETASESTKTMESMADDITKELMNMAGNVETDSAEPIAKSFSETGTDIVKSTKDAVSGMKTEFSSIVPWIVPNVTSPIEKAFQDLAKNIKNILNSIIGTSNSMLTNIESGINAMVSAINRIEIKIPEINIAGQAASSATTVRPSASSISIPQIPRLATGAVIPPNKEFMAIMGDQKHGTNIETPEDLLRQIVREEGSLNTTLLQEQNDLLREQNKILQQRQTINFEPNPAAGRAFRRSIDMSDRVMGTT